MKKQLIIGLTGSIGMGKSTAAKILRQMGLPIYSADKVVHKLLKKNGAGVKPVSKLFPAALKNGAINRKILGREVFGAPAKLRRLEKILHPLVRKEEKKFLAKHRRVLAVVLEIPLMFETGAEKRCDLVLVVTAPQKIQQARVLARPNMNKDKLKAILKQQMPDAEKRRRADVIIHTGKGIIDTKRQLKEWWAHARNRS